MTVQVAGRMFRKSSTKDINGNLINMIDETDGGWIVRNRQIVNPEKWNEYQKREKDKQEAAKAIHHQKTDTNAPDRSVAPNQIDALKKEMGDFKKDVDEKFNAIMAALKK